MEKKLRFAYLRLSKEDGDVTDGSVEESQSIGSQRACISQYLKTVPDLADNFTEIIDDGYSGTHFERPGIKRLLHMVELGNVEVIIVRDLSRFARNYLEAGYYLEYVFPSHNVRFISINDGYDSASHCETTTGLHIAIKNLINQMYSKDISKKIKSSVDLKKLRGEYVYGTAPYGYKKGSKKNSIEIDEPAAQIVRRIFALAKDGKSITEISRILNDEHIITPSVYLSSVRGKYKTRSFWTYESVRNILTNRIYTGDTVPFKSHVVRVGSDHVKQLSEAEQTVIPDTHEAIVTRETFYEAKKTIKSNHKSPSQGKTSVLSSYLVCGCCQNRLSKGKAQNKTFLCTSARYHTESDCKDVRCNEEKMKQLLIRAIHQQCMMMDTQIKMLQSKSKSAKSELESIRIDIRYQQRLLESSRASKMQLYEDYVSGKIGKDRFVADKKELNDKEQTAQIQLKLLEERQNLLEDNRKQANALSEEQTMIYKYKDIDELNEAIMQELVKKIIVYPNGAVNIVWNFKDVIEESNTSNTLVI